MPEERETVLRHSPAHCCWRQASVDCWHAKNIWAETNQRAPNLGRSPVAKQPWLHFPQQPEVTSTWDKTGALPVAKQSKSCFYRARPQAQVHAECPQVMLHLLHLRSSFCPSQLSASLPRAGSQICAVVCY